MPTAHLFDCRRIARLRGIHEISVLGRGKERLADHRFLEDVEQVGGVAPHLVRRGPSHLVAELPPRRDPIPSRAIGIRRTKERRHDLADRFMQDEAVIADLHEREAAQPIEGILGSRLRQMAARTEIVGRRTTAAASSARRVEGSSRVRSSSVSSSTIAGTVEASRSTVEDPRKADAASRSDNG